ncbi:MAG: hypothetical protein IT294_04095 [Deltaproteobacteria bacterium]|nr:hypothetical protein [Deltaproteobacteria bacterium]
MAPEDGTRKATATLAETRLDRWLWAARFFKTRGLAGEAVAGGLVHLNGSRAKPAKPVRLGHTVEVQRGEQVTTVVVRGLSERRGPAAEAVLLYEETPASVNARAEHLARRREAAAGRFERLGRPTKQDRRESIRFRRGR